MFKKSVLIMRGKQNKWRAQQRSQVAERTGDSVGADVTSVSRDQTLTTFIATLASSWNSHHAPGLTEIFIPICVYLTAVFLFFNHAAVDVLAFLSFFLVEFLSVLLFSFGFGHFWHIWWACSRPILFLVLTCRGFATPYSIKYYIGYQVYLLTWFIPEDSMSYPCIYIMQ